MIKSPGINKVNIWHNCFPYVHQSFYFATQDFLLHDTVRNVDFTTMTSFILSTCHRWRSISHNAYRFLKWSSYCCSNLSVSQQMVSVENSFMHKNSFQKFVSYNKTWVTTKNKHQKLSSFLTCVFIHNHNGL